MGTAYGRASPPRVRRPRGARTKRAWLLVVPFFLFATPSWPTIAVGALLAGLGLLIRGWSAGTIRKDERLCTTGPYAHTRNPLYLGSFLVGAGLGAAGGHWLWPLAVGLYFVIAYAPTVAEEAERLTELFGHEYVTYASRVPALLPRLRPYRGVKTGGVGHGEPTFSWARYLRNREWEALLGAATAFVVLALKLRIFG